MRTFVQRIRLTLEMIKIEHTVFALPFAFLGAVLAERGIPPLQTCLWILLAMAGARSAAMAFNRVVDFPFDRENPRTKGRALPSGHLSRRFVVGFIIVSAIVFIGAASRLNTLCFILSFPALAFVLLYSFSKRVTWLSHLLLGVALSIAPAGGWIAVQGTLSIKILLLCGIVMAWVGGFDILYACQDVSFDARIGLFSIPVRFGIHRGLLFSLGLHLITIAALFFLCHVFHLTWVTIAGIIILAVILIWEHALIRPGDLSRINAAFFTLNGIFSVLLFVIVLADIMIEKTR